MIADHASVHAWFSALSRLLVADLSLSDALARLENASPTEALGRASADLARAVATGASFPDALTRHPKLFPASVVMSVRAADDAGGLRGALTAASDVYDADVSARQALRSIWLYAAVITAVLAVFVGRLPLMGVMAGDEVPEMLGGWAFELPSSLTHVFLGLLVVSGLHAALGRTSLGISFDRVKLVAPFVGESLRLALLAPALTVIGELLRRGVTLERALRDVLPSIPNAFLRTELLELLEFERSGRCTARVLRPLERLALVTAWRRGEAAAGFSDVASAMSVRLGERSVDLARWSVPVVLVLLGLLVYLNQSRIIA